MKEKILAINPGSTSTKIAVFAGDENIFTSNLSHSVDELSGLTGFEGQYEYRKKVILDELNKAGIDISDLQAIVGRGGLLRPIPSGVYAVTDAMKEDLKKGWEESKHAANLAALIADEMVRTIPGARAFIADPPVVDEMEDVAKLTGHPKFRRKSIFHALNQKAIARKHADAVGTPYEEMNLIVAHLGGGVSVGAHKKGLIVDVNNALDGDGPFSPERSGGLPVGDMVKLCFSGEMSRDEIKRMIVGKGGITAYLGTNDAREVEKMISEGDAQAELVYNAMIYQVAKDIGAMCTVLSGDVDAVLITGGIAHSQLVIERLKARVEKLAQVYVYPGEDEMSALAMNGLMVLRGKAVVQDY
ncbi:MAG TPA: butyrate kinase [Spirochaetota bacterium]|mgnify:CR=1 FL=1|nr:butyrate kinase [Spirochaetota bacterium]HPJ36972.1 butyrate kinase [Spirochaetota bacterium]HPQ51762.1 butyrate kinase [Spirochaetota bacterium]